MNHKSQKKIFPDSENPIFEPLDFSKGEMIFDITCNERLN